MADQDHDQGIGGLDLFGEFGEARTDLLQVGSVHGGHVGVAAGLLQAAIDIVGPHFEALRVVRFAAEAGDVDVEGRRRQRERGQQQQGKRLHTTPHFLRNSHSEARIPMASRKITGMSQRSRVSRVVIPASE